MKLTLLVDDNQRIQDFITINLKTWIGAHVIAQTSAKFAIEFLKENKSEVKLIICKYSVSTEKTAQAIDEYLQENALSTPFIIIGQADSIRSKFAQLSSSLDIKPLIKASADALNVTAKEMAKLSLPNFFEIPIHYFLEISESATDIYRLKDEGDYELLFEAHSEFPQGAIEALSKKQIKFLYTKSSERLTFVSNITQEIASKMDFIALNPDEKIRATQMSRELLQDKLARVGLTTETVALAQQNIKQMIQNSKSTSLLGKLLRRMSKNQASYLFKHSQLLICISTHLMDHIDWGNEDQKKKMIFISFFHDIALATDEQAMIHSEAELKKSSLSEKDKDLVNRHAQIASELLAKYPKAPMGADIIIRQHHGIPHGIGFSKHYSGSLSPMTIVFILAEDFVGSIIEEDKKFDPKLKITQMREKYPTQRFQKIIDVLESVAF